MNLAGITPVPPPSPASTAAVTTGYGASSANTAAIDDEAAKTNPRTGVSETDRRKNPGTPGNPQLSEDERKQVEELKARNREVRAHEAAHKSAAGHLARGGASFTYQQGPDGKRYAVGGEVNIDTSKVPNDPEATLRKANKIRAAALAPAQPSSQDRAVAAEAAQMAAAASAELAKQAGAGDTGNTGEQQDTDRNPPAQRPAQGIDAYQRVRDAVHDTAGSGALLDLAT